MTKIAICGKRNSGKNTVARMCEDEIRQKLGNKLFNGVYHMAFADPIKEIALLMFPNTNTLCLWGSSNERSTVIPDAFKNGSPLTYRQLLMDLGTEVGRAYDANIWVNNFDYHLNKVERSKPSIITCADVRFRNEMDYLRKKDFYIIKLIRNNDSNVDHISETDQDSFEDNDFNYIMYNVSTLENLRKEVSIIIGSLVC